MISSTGDGLQVRLQVDEEEKQNQRWFNLDLFVILIEGSEWQVIRSLLLGEKIRPKVIVSNHIHGFMRPDHHVPWNLTLVPKMVAESTTTSESDSVEDEDQIKVETLASRSAEEEQGSGGEAAEGAISSRGQTREAAEVHETLEAHIQGEG